VEKQRISLIVEMLAVRLFWPLRAFCFSVRIAVLLRPRTRSGLRVARSLVVRAGLCAE
jgi:hypothetical protein